jgi:hypothetical protein
MGSRLRAGTAALLIGGALLGAAGCYWLRYDKLARTHVDLLLAMTEKLDDVTRGDGRPPAPTEEYRYPLERARDFIRIAARHRADRRSLAALGALCDAYEDLLTAAERMRAAPRGAGDARAFDAAVAAVRERGGRARSALDRESTF